MKIFYKKFFKVIIAILIISFLFSCFAKIFYGKIDDFISEKNIVYVPNNISKKFHKTIISIDTFDYWIFKLNEAQQKEVIADIESERSNWVLADSFHYKKIDEFNYFGEIIEKSSKDSECYICIFDVTSDKVITDVGDRIYPCTNWLIFFYDIQSDYYYCIHQSF